MEQHPFLQESSVVRIAADETPDAEQSSPTKPELALARKHRSIMVFVISPASGLTEGSESAEECLAESAPEQREGKEEESQHPGQGILLNAFLAAVPPPDPTAQRRQASRPGPHCSTSGLSLHMNPHHAADVSRAAMKCVLTLRVPQLQSPSLRVVSSSSLALLSRGGRQTALLASVCSPDLELLTLDSD
ncbi:hypothetical protein AOLI_G00028730 [Acnodon oligacanthus]